MIIEALDAANGDAAILRHTGNTGQDVVGLIDGGPSSVFANAIRPALDALGITATAGSLDWLAVSHVDSDHIGGVLRLVIAEFAVRRFYFNTPSPFPDSGVVPAAVGPTPEQALEEKLSDLLGALPPALEVQVASIKQGQELLDEIVGRGIDLLNPPTNQRLLVGDSCDIDGLTLSVVAPSQARIDALLDDWADEVGGGAVPASAEKMDTSVTNLSSLVFLAEADGKTALFTGDALEDDIVDGLETLGHHLPMHVDLLKVPHHGSNSPANPVSLVDGRGLIENVTADHYVVSADGTSKNPALPTLERIVKAAKPGSTIWIPSPPSTEATPSDNAQYYMEKLDELEDLVDAAVDITLKIGDGAAPLVIDLT
jgi:hypothetical protein